MKYKYLEIEVVCRMQEICYSAFILLYEVRAVLFAMQYKQGGSGAVR